MPKTDVFDNRKQSKKKKHNIILCVTISLKKKCFELNIKLFVLYKNRPVSGLNWLPPIKLDLPADLLHAGPQHRHVLLQLLHAEHEQAI